MTLAPHLILSARKIQQVSAIPYPFVKLSRSLQLLSIFWTSSGSCPLCLTPPCYHLEPPVTAALFLYIGAITAFGAATRQLCRKLCRQPRWTPRPSRAMLSAGVRRTNVREAF